MVSATGNIRKEKSRNMANYLRIEKGLKKKAFELSTLVGVDVCMIILDPAEQHVQATDHYCPVEPGTYPDNSQEVHRIIQRYREYITTTTTGVLGGKKKKRNNRDLTQKKKSAEVLVTSSEQDDDALVKGGGGSLLVQNFETEEELENEFMEELRNELMGFDEQNVNTNNHDSSSEFLVEGDMIWSSDELNEIVNGFGGDNADHYEGNNMFDQLSPLYDPPLPLPLTNNAFIDNILNTTSDNWPAGTSVLQSSPSKALCVAVLKARLHLREQQLVLQQMKKTVHIYEDAETLKESRGLDPVDNLITHWNCWAVLEDRLWKKKKKRKESMHH